MTRHAFLATIAVGATVGTVGVLVVAGDHAPSRAVTSTPVASTHLATIDSGGLSTGPLDARVVVRILGDYECGACRKLDATAGRELRELAASESLRYAYIHAPLRVHRRGALAAAAMYCAAEQDKAWALHEVLYERAAEWAAGEPAKLRFEQYATELGLDADRLSACIESPGTRGRVQQDNRAATAAGQAYVPVVMINDRIVRGAAPDEIMALVRQHLSMAEAGQPSSTDAIRPPGPYLRAAPVIVAPVLRGDLAVSIQATGTVHARRTAELKAEVGSVVLRIAAKEGKAVRAGERVATFDRIPLELSLRDAVLRREQALLHFGEATLFDDRITDPALREARTRNARVRSGLAAADLDVARAELALERSELRSPFSGIVTRVHVHAGDLVRPGQDVAEVAALDTFYIEALVLETELPRIRAGAAARIDIPADGALQLAGIVASVPNVVDSATRSGTVRIAVPRGGEWIRPGMFATVTIEVERHRERLIVPRSALVERDERTLLFLFEGGEQVGRALWRYVAVEASNDSTAAIATMTGDPPVEPGDRVITSGHSSLVHEARVRLQDSVPS